MSKPGETLYVVALHHLAADAKRAGADIADSQLNYIPAKRLRALLDGVEALAPSVVFPTEPELRITAPNGKFVVQVKGGKLHFVSWSSGKKGGEFTAERIYATITGEEVDDGGNQRAVASIEPGGFQRMMTTGTLVVAIIAVNAFTFWMLTKPPKNLLPKYTLLEKEPAERALAEIAGVYETGSGPGDRRMEILNDGTVQRIKYGAERKSAEKQVFTVKPAETAGKKALLTSRKAMITIKDSVSVVLYGDTYQRVTR